MAISIVSQAGLEFNRRTAPCTLTAPAAAQAAPIAGWHHSCSPKHLGRQAGRQAGKASLNQRLLV